MIKKFSKEYLTNELDLPYNAIEDKIIDSGRWSINHEIIGERIAYLIYNPTQQFFDDWKAQYMRPVNEKGVYIRGENKSKCEIREE